MTCSRPLLCSAKSHSHAAIGTVQVVCPDLISILRHLHLHLAVQCCGSQHGVTVYAHRFGEQDRRTAATDAACDRLVCTASQDNTSLLLAPAATFLVLKGSARMAGCALAALVC